MYSTDCLQLWSSEYPEAYANGKVDFIPIDFFEEAPAENCDIYFVSLLKLTIIIATED